MAYNVLLRREPDPAGVDRYLPSLIDGRMTADELVDHLRGSDEFQVRTPMSEVAFGPSLHASRCHFIRSLPAARTIVDLGGTHSANPWGAMVLLGYPHPFDQLTVVDLPPDERHPLYRSERYQAVETPLGPVSYSFHSMTDLSGFDSESVDLVYSGQSIEHVTTNDAEKVCAEVFRILRPGGSFALDTPNGRVTRLQSPEFIDPDHEHEYTTAELTDLLTGAGFEVPIRFGLNLARRSVEAGEFDPAEVAGNSGLYADPDSCYLLAFVARKPH